MGLLHLVLHGDAQCKEDVVLARVRGCRVKTLSWRGAGVRVRGYRVKRAWAGVSWGPRGRVLTLVLVSQCASSCCTRMLSSAATQSHRNGLSRWQPGCATVVYLPKRSRICTVPVVTIVHGRQRARPPLEELHISMTGLKRVLVVGGALRVARSRWNLACASCCVRCRSIWLGGSGRWGGSGGSGARGAGRCDSVRGCGAA